MPDRHKDNPIPPLPPNFSNMRARIEEHNKLMADARRLWPGRPICPDHYGPGDLCGCGDPLAKRAAYSRKPNRRDRGG